MKKLLFVLASVLILSGCGTQEKEVFETIGNVSIQEQDLPAAGAIDIYLPEQAALQTMAEDGVQVYGWDDYEVRMETRSAGDIAATMQAITGMDADELTVMKQQKDDITLYQTVWSTTGEDGILCGRAMVADDGNYHYCVSLLNPETVNSDNLYAKMAASFQISPADIVK